MAHLRPMANPTTKLEAPAVADLRREWEDESMRRKRSQRGAPDLITKRDMERALGVHKLTFRDYVETMLQTHGPSLSNWIGQIANGVQDEAGDWIIPPNPSQAIAHITAIAEFAVPKLSRTEITGADGSALQVEVVALVAAAQPRITSPVAAADVVEVEVDK